MRAIDKLRNIAMASSDPRIKYDVEYWINEHCLEFSNSFVLHKRYKNSPSPQMEQYSEDSLRRIATEIIRHGSGLTLENVMEHPRSSFVNGGAEDSNEFKFFEKFERKVTIIMDKGLGR